MFNRRISFWAGVGIFFFIPIAMADDPPTELAADDDVGGAVIERPEYDPGRSTQVIDFWRRRVERDPRALLSWRELAGAYLARHHETGRIADAIEAERSARRAAVLTPRGEVGEWPILGRALLSQHQFPEALALAEKAVTQDPGANRLLCDVLIETGEVEKAQEAFRRAPLEGDELTALVLEARLLEAQGKGKEMLERLRKARDLSAGMPQLPHELGAWYHVRLGHSLIDRGEIAEERASCEAALAIFPRDARALVGLAEAAAAESKWADASKYGEQALEYAPEDPEAVRIVGEASEHLGLKEKAERQYRRLRELAESSPRIYDRHFATFCVDHNRDLDEALRKARADLAIRRDAGAYSTLAKVLGKLDRFAEARDAIVLAMDKAPWDSKIRSEAESIAKALGVDVSSLGKDTSSSPGSRANEGQSPKPGSER